MVKTLNYANNNANHQNIILVGCGNMGYAMLQSWIDKNVVSANNVFVVEPNQDLQSRALMLGVHTFANVNALNGALKKHSIKPDLVVFAVKPQIMDKIVPEYSEYINHACFLSIVAGLPVSFFTNILGESASIIRCMPNTPASIGEGMLVLYFNKNVNENMQNYVKTLLAVNGAVAEVSNEEQMDAVTGLSGSGPAYVFHMIEAMTKAGVAMGLPEKTASLLACQTVKGAGALAAKSKDSPTILRQQVTSPHGTTAAGLAILMGDQNLEKLMFETVKAATLRSIELGK